MSSSIDCDDDIHCLANLPHVSNEGGMSVEILNFSDPPSSVLRSDESRVETSTSPSQSHTRKKKVVKKAPNAPKRFKSSYICFVEANMKVVKKTSANDAKVTDAMKILANMWKMLPPHERLKYEKQAKSDKRR
jgi:hypothetical protein